MKNITKKDLQRMKELMGNKKPINENTSTSPQTGSITVLLGKQKNII